MKIYSVTMKNLLHSFVAIALSLCVYASSTSAQNLVHQTPGKLNNFKSTKSQIPSEYSSSSQSAGVSSSVPMDPLSALVSVPNASWTSIAGLFDLQSNGRGLHNIQVDPDNPNHIHVCAMTTTSVDPTDTNGSAYPSRRVLYAFSADGGAT